MHSLQAYLFKYITVSAFRIYALHGEDLAKSVHYLVMELTLMTMENHGTVFVNFCGNPIK